MDAVEAGGAIERFAVSRNRMLAFSTGGALRLGLVDAGAVQAQGTINGFGERCGNTDLIALVPNLAIKKQGYELLDPGALEHLTELSRYVYETVNMNFPSRQPFVGKSAFAHKGGMHVSAIARNSASYEHIDPVLVGNERRILVSELSGRSNIVAMATKHNIQHDQKLMDKILAKVVSRENAGYQFEAADGSFELLLRKAQGWKQDFFELESYRVYVEHRDNEVVAEATVKVHVGGERVVTTREGDGPVSALDRALRAALVKTFPEVAEIQLTDYRVRDLDSSDGTSARVRVLCEHADIETAWGTVGVHENIIDASWKAVVEGLVIGLLRHVERNGHS